MPEMLEDVVFVGDELTASAFRLAGIRVTIVEPADTMRALDEESSRDTSLVLLGAPNANAMALDELLRRIRLASPPITVVGDAGGKASVPDFAIWLKRRLGVAL